MNDQSPNLATVAPADLHALRRCRLHDNTRKALEAMAHEGLPLLHAAERFKVDDSTLYRAMLRPHVKQAFAQVLKAIREGAAQAAYLKINHLAHTADSKRLQFDASRWIAGVDGISPVQKVDARHQHNVQFQGFAYPDIHAKDVTPADSKSPDDDE